jgi:hypothetical protein
MSTADPDAIPGQKDELDKWNWGAFLWGAIWALGHRLWGKGILALVVTIITLGLAGLVFQIWFALKGNRMIWERGGYSTREELRQKERKWAWAYLWVTLAWVALYVLVIAVGS